MKRQGLVSAFLLTLVLVAGTGCPFEAKVPIGKASPASLDPRLFGAWTDTSADSARILVLPFNETEYYVEVTEKDGRRDHYRVAPITLAGRQMLQVNELSAQATPDGYVFARCSLTPDGALSLRFVGEKIVPKSLQKDSQGLADFIAAHLDDPALEDEDTNILLRR